MKIQKSVLKDCNKIFSPFDSLIMNIDGNFLNFFSSNAEMSNFSVVRIKKDHKTKSLKTVGLNIDHLSNVDSLGKEIDIKISDRFTFKDDKSKIEIPLLEIDEELNNFIGIYIPMLDKENSDEVVEYISKRKEKKDQSINKLVDFELDTIDIDRIIKFATKANKDSIKIYGDGKNIYISVYNKDSSIGMETKIKKTSKKFERSYKVDFIKLISIIGECNVKLFENEKDPMIVYKNSSDLIIIIFISGQVMD